MKNLSLSLLTAGALTLTLSPAAQASGPLSEYFLTTSDGYNKLYAVQGGNVSLNATIGPRQYALAVGTTVRTLGVNTSTSGKEYTLRGAPIGSSYSNTVAGALFADGTTDGVHNYAWDFSNGVAYRFAADWTSPQALFALGTSDGTRRGITYDPVNNSLWVSGTTGAVGALVENYTLTGTFLSSFSTGRADITALALDPADDTLWLGHYDHTGTYQQYSRTGRLIGSVTYSSLFPAGVVGGEFAQTVPEPGVWPLAAMGLVLLSSRRRR
jgi:uncharacterized protein (TIGR03382 family)